MVLEVEVVDLRLGCCVTAVLTHVHLHQQTTGVKLQPHIARRTVLFVFRAKYAPSLHIFIYCTYTILFIEVTVISMLFLIFLNCFLVHPHF